MEIKNEILIAVITGLISSIATVTTIKTDVDWIKVTLSDHGTRIIQLEREPKNGN